MTTYDKLWNDLLEMFRGLVWSCEHLIGRKQRPENEVRVLTHQMQQFKMGKQVLGITLINSLLFRAMSQIGEARTWCSIVNDISEIDDYHRGLVWQAATTAFGILTDALLLLREVPEAAGSETMSLREILNRRERFPAFRETLDRHGLTEKILDLLKIVEENERRKKSIYS
jgi:hypothetical protein